MVRFLDVASLLFFSCTTIVAANSIPREKTNVVALVGRFTLCGPEQGESYI